MKAAYVQPSVDFFGLKVRGRSIWGGRSRWPTSKVWSANADSTGGCNSLLELCNAQTAFHFLEDHVLGVLEFVVPLGDASSSMRRFSSDATPQ